MLLSLYKLYIFCDTAKSNLNNLHAAMICLFSFFFFLNPAQVIRGKLLDIHSCIGSTFIDLCRSVSSRHQVTLNDIYYNYYLHDSQIKRKVKWMIKVTLLALFYSLFHFFFVGIFSLPYFKRSL